MKEKVTKLLIKWGNNPADVEKMVSEHFEQASNQFKTARQMADFIRIIY